MIGRKSMKITKRIAALTLGIALVGSNFSNVAYAQKNVKDNYTITKYQNDTNYYKNFMKFEKKTSVDSIKMNGNKFQTKRLIVEGILDEKILSKIDEKDVFLLSEEREVLSFSTIKDTEKAYKVIKNSGEVDDVYGENVYSVNETLTPDDFKRKDNLSWGSDFVESPALVDYINDTASINKDEVVVAVVDTGVNVDHSIFKDRIAEGGRSYVDNERDIDDKYGHGTHVAGIIVDNTPKNVKILPVKALGGNGKGTELGISQAIDYAVSKKVDVINMSLGGKANFTSSVVESSIKDAKKAGISVVVSAGNDNESADNCSPARAKECITVAASDENGDIADFSNYGYCVDVCAPGVSIYSSYKKNYGYIDTYNYESGTSMASPYVSSAICMVKMMHKDYSVSQIETFIENHVINYAGDQRYGTGIIDLGSYTDTERCSDVVFNYPSGDYSDELNITLSCDTAGADIYYTTDNTTPSVNNGKKYTGAFAVDEATQVKAIAIKSGLGNSNVTKAEYRYRFCDFDSNFLIRDGVICGYKGDCKELRLMETIQDEVITEVGYRAFRKSACETIYLCPHTEKIAEEAFAKSNICNVYVGDVKYIGRRCFYDCDSFYSNNISLGGVTYIGEEAFAECDNLTELYFPSCLYAGGNIVNGCKKVKVLFFPKCKNVVSATGRDINANSEYKCSKEGNVVTSEIDEDIFVFATPPSGTYSDCYGKVKKGQSIIVPEGAKLNILYNDSFKEVSINGKRYQFENMDEYWGGVISYKVTGETTIAYSSSNKKDLDEANVFVTTGYKYCGTGITPEIKVSLFGKELSKDDYDIECSNNIERGIARMDLVGKGEYKGSKTLYFYIDYLTFADCTCEIPDCEYTGSQIKPDIKLMYNGNVINSYKIVAYAGNVMPGDDGGSIYLEGKGSLTGETRYDFNIYCLISKAKISIDDSKLFEDGSPKKPSVTVEFEDELLTSPYNYTLSFSDNIKAGKGKVTVTGAGYFRGKVDVYFTIRKTEVKKNGGKPELVSKEIKKTSIKKARYAKKKLQLKWKKVSGVSGYEIVISSSKSFKKNTKSFTVKRAYSRKTIKNIKNKKIKLRLNKKKAVYVRIRTFIKSGKKYVYSDWSKKVKVKY